MMIKQLTTAEIKKNMHDNIRIMICIFLTCIVIGTSIGIISAMSYNPKESIDKTEIEEQINLENIDSTNVNYYRDVFVEIKAKNDYLEAYLEYFESMNLSQENRIKIEEIEREVKGYQNSISNAIEFYITTPLAVGENKNAAINDVYIPQVKEIKKEIRYQENLLAEIIDGKYTDAYKNSQQDIISEKITMLKKEEASTNKVIMLLNDISYIDLRANNIAAENIIRQNVELLNESIVKFNKVLSEISKSENYEIVYNKNLLESYELEAGINGKISEEDILNNKKETAIIYAKSIEGLDIRSERFFAIFMFFVLFGACIAIFVGAIYKKKETMC